MFGNFFFSFQQEAKAKALPSGWVEDFLESPRFQEILSTLSDEETDLPLLLLGVYTDGFDPQNSLSSHGQNGVSATYLYIMNMPPHLQSLRQRYMQVQFVYERDIKLFGFNRCYQRLVTDLKQLIFSGLSLQNGQKVAVRLAQHRLDSLERNKVLRIGESFSCSKYFSPYTYITTKARIEAKKVADLLPSKFRIRDQEAYEKDLVHLRDNVDSHGTKEESVFNDLPFYKVAALGSCPPCIQHDCFSGFA